MFQHTKTCMLGFSSEGFGDCTTMVFPESKAIPGTVLAGLVADFGHTPEEEVAPSLPVAAVTHGMQSLVIRVDANPLK